MAKRSQPQKTQPAEKPAGVFKILFHPLFIFAFAFALYSNTLTHGFVQDDGAVITDNVTVNKGFAGMGELLRQSSVYGSTKQNYGSYRPVVMLLFATEMQFFGSNAMVFHFIHVFFYALCCAVVFLTLKKLFRQFFSGVLLAGVAALLFAAHPVHTEVGANIKSTDEVLGLLFGCLSLYAALCFAESNQKKFLFGGTVTLLFALFSKESTITFLALIPIALLLFTSAKTKTLFQITAANMIPVILVLLARNAVLETPPGTLPLVDNALVGAKNASERIGSLLNFLLYYLRLLVFPHPLTWEYNYNHLPLVNLANPMAILSLMLHVAMIVFALATLWKSVTAKTENRKLKTENIFAFAILFYLITLSPVSNVFFRIASTIAERFLFMPSLGFCILLAVGLLVISKFKINGAPSGNKAILLALLLLVLIPAAAKTFTRNKDWKSNLTLFAAGVKVSSDSYRANAAYAWENLIAGEKETAAEKKKVLFTTAVEHFKKALSIYGVRADDWYNYGVANGHLNQTSEAMKAYSQAVALNPKHRNSCYNLASLYLGQNDFSNALKYFLNAYAADSNFSDVRFKIGLCYHYLNDFKNAIPYYEKHLKAYPNSRDTVNNLALAYQALGDAEKSAFYSAKLQQMK